MSDMLEEQLGGWCCWTRVNKERKRKAKLCNLLFSTEVASVVPLCKLGNMFPLGRFSLTGAWRS